MDNPKTTAELLAELEQAHKRIAVLESAMQRQPDELFASQLHSSPFFTQSPDGYLLTDEHGRITEWNQQLTRITGLPREQALGTMAWDIQYRLAVPDLRAALNPEQFQETLAGVLQTGAAQFLGQPIDIEIQTPQGERKLIQQIIFSIPTARGYCLGAMIRDITELKLAEQNLLASEGRFRKIFEQAAVGVAQVESKTGGFVQVNQAYCDIVGLTREQLLETDFQSITHPDDLQADLDNMQLLLAGEIRAFTMEKRYVHRDGSVVWVTLTVSPMWDAGAEPDTHIAVVEDITERKQAEAALQKSQAMLADAQQIAHLGSWEWDLQTDRVWWSDETYRIFGVEPAEYTPSFETNGKFIHPEDLDHYARGFEHSIKTGEPLELDVRILAGDGVLKHCDARAQVIRDASGQPVRFVGVLIDITDRKQAEESLHASEARYRMLLETTLQGIWSMDRQRLTTYVNQPMAGMLGYEPAEMLGKNAEDFAFERDAEIHEFHYQRRQAGQDEIYERRFKRRDGSELWTLVSARALKDAQGDYDGAFSMLTDITDRKHAEQALQASEKQYRQLSAELEARVRQRTAEIDAIRQRLELATQVANLGVWDWNIITGQLFWDDQVYSIYRVSKDSFPVSLERFISLVHPDDVAGLLQFTQDAIAGRPSGQVEYRVLRGDNSLGYVKVHGAITQDAQGQPVHVIGVVQDVTQDKLAEISLRESEARLRQNRDQLTAAYLDLERASHAKDEFLANMSHELRTPLNGILGFAEALQLQTYGPLDASQVRAVKFIDASGRHLLSLINDILDLSKIEAGKLEVRLEPVSVFDICQASLAFIKEPALKKGLAVEFEIDPPAILLQADPKRLKQILVNLLSNAVKFTAAGGKITLQASLQPLAGTVELAVRDTGIGIAPADLERLFSPFTQVDNSLTRNYEGSGLGLALARRLANLHGGSITVESQPGSGSLFTLRLPWQAPLAAPPAAPQTAGLAASKTGLMLTRLARATILLVEDNPTNILVVADFLEANGCSLVYAHNGRQALEQAALSQPDLILMDIEMPEMDGLEATRRLRADPRFAATPIIALTARAMVGDAERCLQAGASDYVSKPVRLIELAAKIEALLQ